MVESTYVYRDGILNGGIRLFIVSFIPVVIMGLIFNLISAFIAMNMAKKRGLEVFPHFLPDFLHHSYLCFLLQCSRKKSMLSDASSL